MQAKRFAEFFQGQLKLRELTDKEALFFARAVSSSGVEEIGNLKLAGNADVKTARHYLGMVLEALDKGLDTHHAGTEFLPNVQIRPRRQIHREAKSISALSQEYIGDRNTLRAIIVASLDREDAPSREESIKITSGGHAYVFPSYEAWLVEQGILRPLVPENAKSIKQLREIYVGTPLPMKMIIMASVHLEDAPPIENSIKVTPGGHCYILPEYETWLVDQGVLQLSISPQAKSLSKISEAYIGGLKALRETVMSNLGREDAPAKKESILITPGGMVYVFPVYETWLVKNNLLSPRISEAKSLRQLKKEYGVYRPLKNIVLESLKREDAPSKEEAIVTSPGGFIHVSPAYEAWLVQQGLLPSKLNEDMGTLRKKGRRPSTPPRAQE